MSGIVPEIGGLCEGYSDVRSANYMGYICEYRKKDTKGGLIFSKPFPFKGKTQYFLLVILQTILSIYWTIKLIILLLPGSLNGLLMLITQLNLATSPTQALTRRFPPSTLSQREQSTIRVFNQPKPQSLPTTASPKGINKIALKEIIKKLAPKEVINEIAPKGINKIALKEIIKKIAPKEVINEIAPAFKSKSEEGGDKIEISEGEPEFLGEIKQEFGIEPLQGKIKSVRDP
jgi:hypothetical protein